MGQYSEGWLTVPGKGKRWRDSEGNYSRLRPGFGSQTLGATGVAIQNMFRGNKDRAFPDTFKDQYDADPAYSIPEVVISPDQGQKIADVAPRDESRTNPKGVVQSGKNLSPASSPIVMTRDHVNAMYERQGIGFSSNQLPETGDNPFNSQSSVTPGFPTETPDIGGYNGASYDSEGGASAAGSKDLSQFKPMTGNEQRLTGASERVGSGTLSEALADTDGIRSYMKKFSSGDRERAANRAFLDTEGSMEGLRAKEKVNKVVYAGGQHHIEDGEGYKAIERSESRDISNGKTSADALLAKYKKNITESQDETPAEAQDPTTSFQQGIDSGISEASSTDNQLTTRDFNLNNNEGNGGFDTTIDIGNKGGKGYKRSFGGM